MRQIEFAVLGVYALCSCSIAVRGTGSSVGQWDSYRGRTRFSMRFLCPQASAEPEQCGFGWCWIGAVLQEVGGELYRFCSGVALQFRRKNNRLASFAGVG